MSDKVKIRIALSVDETGNWHSTGYADMKDADGWEFNFEGLLEGEARYWIECEVDKPERLIATITDATITEAEKATDAIQ